MTLSHLGIDPVVDEEASLNGAVDGTHGHFTPLSVQRRFSS
jgi:hypothetical protein